METDVCLRKREEAAGRRGYGRKERMDSHNSQLAGTLRSLTGTSAWEEDRDRDIAGEGQASETTEVQTPAEVAAAHFRTVEEDD